MRLLSIGANSCVADNRRIPRSQWAGPPAPTPPVAPSFWGGIVLYKLWEGQRFRGLVIFQLPHFLIELLTLAHSSVATTGAIGIECSCTDLTKQNCLVIIERTSGSSSVLRAKEYILITGDVRTAVDEDGNPVN